jgi:hypothetical protein
MHFQVSRPEDLVLVEGVWRLQHYPDAPYSQVFMARALISTLYVCISLFLMIYDICMTFRHNIQLGPYSRMCFDPLGIYMVILIISNLL